MEPIILGSRTAVVGKLLAILPGQVAHGSNGMELWDVRVPQFCEQDAAPQVRASCTRHSMGVPADTVPYIDTGAGNPYAATTFRHSDCSLQPEGTTKVSEAFGQRGGGGHAGTQHFGGRLTVCRGASPPERGEGCGPRGRAQTATTCWGRVEQRPHKTQKMQTSLCRRRQGH